MFTLYSSVGSFQPTLGKLVCVPGSPPCLPLMYSRWTTRQPSYKLRSEEASHDTFCPGSHFPGPWGMTVASQEPPAACRLQEVSKNWSESSFIAHNVQALSPEVRDLLDKIFKVDPKKRITVRGIMEHPWYNKQLPAKYQDALDRIEEQQAVLEKHVQQIKLDPVRPHRLNQPTPAGWLNQAWPLVELH